METFELRETASPDPLSLQPHLSSSGLGGISKIRLFESTEELLAQAEETDPVDPGYETPGASRPEILEPEAYLSHPIYKEDDSALQEFQKSHEISVEIPVSTLVYPRSQYQGEDPLHPYTSERTALVDLMAFVKTQGGDHDFVEFGLDDFAVYINAKKYPFELRPLQHLATKSAHDNFYFDGVLSIGDIKHRVHEVPFKELPIGNYGTDEATVGDQIWIRSATNEHKEIYYRLRNPATEYARFHAPFLWVADLGKHFVDYCGDMLDRGRKVYLADFRARFGKWLSRTHKSSPSLRRWLRWHNSGDFSTAVVANAGFLWKETCGVLKLQKARSLGVFREIRSFDRYKAWASRPKTTDVAPTVVTPYIYDCFRNTPVGTILNPIEPSRPLSKPCTVSGTSEGAFSSSISSANPGVLSTENRQRVVERITPGDTISTSPDGEGVSKWRIESSKGSIKDTRWFGLVQKVHTSEKAGPRPVRSFDVTWLYRPVDTPCCKMTYPWNNELFLSDHCTCEDGRNARIHEDEVLGTHTVDWMGSPDSKTCDFFVRQTYLVEHRRWVSLQRSHLTCSHERSTPMHKPGDTVLATLDMDPEFSEPYEVDAILKQENNTFLYRLRLLLRRNLVDTNAPATPRNELVYTERFVVTEQSRVLGNCLVRIFWPGEKLSTPYDRNGTGNAFFITHREHVADGEAPRYVPLRAGYPASLRQGFDPKRRGRKLRGLDLFCGGGNFGRGLEDGGAVEVRWANDIWDKAMHTYMVNTRDSKVNPFLGSVDDLLYQALTGQFSESVPAPGEVDFISGGSPCQGFSLLTLDKSTDQQKKNRSMVASFASFIDFYRPKYGVLENVLAIIPKKNERDNDVFSQLICAVVGMGYQAQVILGDAWSHGAPQRRSRIFLCFASPGFRLPKAPRNSHSHPPHVESRSLGEMTNREPYVVRLDESTPFSFQSAREATSDLPDIGDAMADCCVPFPDHRLSIGLSERYREQIGLIPTRPYGMNFSLTWYGGCRGRRGVMTAAERELFPKDGQRVQRQSHGWGRVPPTGIFSTVATYASVTDSRLGRLWHWEQSRPVSLMEARRAQGFLDHEVLLGRPHDQWRMVGNSVARQMALAIGLSLREAWFGTLYDDDNASLLVADETKNKLEAGSDDDIFSAGSTNDSPSREGSATSSEDMAIPKSPSAELVGLPQEHRSTPATSVSEPPVASRKRPLFFYIAIESKRIWMESDELA